MGVMRDFIIPSFMFHESDNCLFVARAYHSVAYTEISLNACLNRSRRYGNGASSNDLFAMIRSAGLTFFLSEIRSIYTEPHLNLITFS